MREGRGDGLVDGVVGIHLLDEEVPESVRAGDSPWPVIDDMHELGPPRQLELLVMLARRSGKLAEF